MLVVEDKWLAAIHNLDGPVHAEMAVLQGGVE